MTTEREIEAVTGIITDTTLNRAINRYDAVMEETGDFDEAIKSVLEIGAKAAIPEGFVLAPKEPSWGMIKAATVRTHNQDECLYSNIYKAMIGARHE